MVAHPLFISICHARSTNRSRKMETGMHFPGKGFEHIRCAEGYTERPRIDGPRGHSAGYGHHIESHGEKVEDFKTV